jgi:hypothetical protein
MTISLLQFFLLLLLFVTAYQDFKYRAIWWGLIPLLTIAIGVLGFQELGHYLWRFWLVNGLFFGLQLLVLTIYFSLKSKQVINITNRQLGLGDILFFIPLSALFSLRNLIVFLLFVLLTAIITAFLLPKHRQNIPLAGIFSVGLIIVLGLEWLSIVEVNRFF